MTAPHDHPPWKRHWHTRHHRRRRWRLGTNFWLNHYIRARLRRRLFLSFGLTLATMVGVAFAIFTFLQKDGAGWERERARLEQFTRSRFAHVWENPEDRAELAHAVASELGVDVTLKDTQGKTVVQEGNACTQGMDVPIQKDGKPLGTAKLCLIPRHYGPHGRGFWVLAAAALVLWMATGRLARRLTRPLAELGRVAEALGQGKLKERAVLSHRDGEFFVLGQVLNDMAGRIERQLADQRELLAAVSHELRTPLARVRILSELIRDAGGPEQHLSDLDREVVEMDALVGELLARSRLEFFGKSLHKLRPRDVAVRALERASLPTELFVLEGDDSATFAADPTLLARALANLLDNARKHGKGVRALRVIISEGSVIFGVMDRGPGIPMEILERSFQPFVQGKAQDLGTSGDASSGLGLGLSLVRRIAEAHGGRAFTENLPEGAFVALELPRSAV